MARTRGEGDRDQPTLFSQEPVAHLGARLDLLSWPPQDRFPLNRPSETVRRVVLEDLAGSDAFTVVAGYSSVGELIELLARWAEAHDDPNGAKVLFGAEPFASGAKSFGDPRAAFTNEARDYWLRNNVSILLSAKVLQVIDLVESGAVSARIVAGDTPLHAKIYVGSDAASIGSSNYTRNGLAKQAEANARFVRSGDDKSRYRELAAIAANYWELGEPWDEEFLELLRLLLKLVSWRESLARACAELLEGDWASNYVAAGSGGARALWPSQRAGIAQALWIIESVGSVLVADPTGSGKTRMGAQLVRAVRDRLWSTGRIRRDITALVCPPAVLDTWRDEGLKAGIQLHPVSHGVLSRSNSQRPSFEHQTVRDAQLLAVDEAHNFLNTDSKRTRTLREHLADHVMLFTATPISRSAGDLLDLVALLGPDNFDDATIEVLNRLDRAGRESTLAATELGELRSEIARFTLRRTKGQINRLVDRSPDDYRHPDTGRVCRFPDHRSHTYDTGETPADAAIADRVRQVTEEILGVTLLPKAIKVPDWLRHRYDDDQWLKLRLASARGLAQHRVLDSLRSSRAALTEHLLGTATAVAQFELARSFKSMETGGMVAKIEQLAEDGPPDVSSLACEVPDWISDAQAWSEACRSELGRYREIADLTATISDARELRKRDLLVELSTTHDRVLAFDRHLVTLAVLEELIAPSEATVVMATGQLSRSERRKFLKSFAPDSTDRAIALCSDAMNEGINLQGASILVHLDLPTTLRVAEQRVGRVERMDSRHDAIESWWPDDGPSFATRANEKLVRRAEESETLLGSNLTLPDFAHGASGNEIVSVQSQIDEFNSNTETQDWDGIRDALDPVRRLVDGEHALVDQQTYEHYRHVETRVMSYVTALESEVPWAFLAVRATAQGAPRWMLVEGENGGSCEVDIGAIADRLRVLLAGDPPGRALDDGALEWLTESVTTAAREEHRLLPRRMIRGLDQGHDVIRSWAEGARKHGNWDHAGRWERLAAATRPSADEAPDLYAVAERWLTLVAPLLEEHQRGEQRRARFTLLRDITPRLKAHPFPIDEVERHFSGVPYAAPLADRVSACIIGVPTVSRPEAAE